jgi:hypothetical protein
MPIVAVTTRSVMEITHRCVKTRSFQALPLIMRAGASLEIK